DPRAYAANTEIPTSAFKTVMDCASGTRGDDWYLGTGATRQSTFDRGVRISPVINYFDGNDPRTNPSTPPSEPPTPGKWLSRAPDGFGRWAWGDSYHNTGCWIDGPNKRGFLTIASLGGGRCWYGSSTLHYGSRQFEFHVYDPAQFGEALQGKRPVWNV